MTFEMQAQSFKHEGLAAFPGIRAGEALDCCKAVNK